MALGVLILVCVIPGVWGFKSGLVTASCADMTPHHGGTPQTGNSPYTVTTDQSSFKPGDVITVRLQGSQSTFDGFLLEARAVGGSTPVGSFSVSPGTSQLLSCNQKSNSAVSHTSNSAKSNIVATWTSAASENLNAVQFHASFVKNYQTYWVDVTSPVLHLTGSPPSTTAKPTAATMSSADCGSKKVCISQPSGCDPSASTQCFFMSAMMVTSNSAAVQYEIAGPSPGYVAFGFSDDQNMGNDDIYICVLNPNGAVSVQHAFSTGRSAPQILALGNVSNLDASVLNGVIKCTFTSMNTVSTQRTSGFNQSYYILFAYGPSSNGAIQFHTNTFTSSQKIQISNPLLVQTEDFPQIMKAHGALMLVAWMTTGSLGMIVARHLRGMAKGRNIFGKAYWFVIHITAMSVTVAATIIAFILAFSNVMGWADGVHSVLGCLVMIFSIIQPSLALLRCEPQHPRRYLFNLSHALIGAALKLLSVAAIFTGLNMIDTTTNHWLMGVMGGFVAWEVLFYTMLELLKKRKLSLKDSNSLPEESEGFNSKTLVVALYIVGNLAFLVALLVGIGSF